MDIPRARGTPAIRIHESQNNSENSQASLRSPTNWSATSQDSARPMPVPKARQDESAPPPLPPPKYIDDLARGFDPGWAWGNSNNGSEPGKGTLAPIRQGSSLQGGYLHKMEDPRSPPERMDDEMELDLADRRGSSVSTLRSLPDAERPPRSAGSLDTEGESSRYSPSHQLQSERPLAQRSLENSSHAYDKHLLSKFGKPVASAVHNTGSRSDSVPNVRSFYPQNTQPRSLSSVEFPSTAGEQGALRHLNTSLGASPTAHSSWKDSPRLSAGPASASTAPSSASDPDHWQFVRRGEHGRVAHSSSGSALFDEPISGSHSHRGSYDLGIPPEADFEPSSEEARAFRQLQLDDRAPGLSDRRASGQGQKRRRRSGSRDKMQDVTPTSVQNLHPRSPHEQLQYHQGSVSSVSSGGLRHGSYTSSAGVSVGRSSITSISTYEKSPGRHSPKPDADMSTESSYSFPGSLSEHVSSLPTRTLKPATALETKMSTSLPAKTASTNTSKTKSSSKASGTFVCNCCPKKPKRFGTAEELRQHTTEKQYECAYCGNRFKNKNEAERHQNSLHLRRHSWSCAAIAGPEAAFHPTSTGNGHNTGRSSTDSCGYCGQKFDNNPRPDWNARKAHLMVVHKFGECNKAKKFYRADHFRQHLKHSHAGTSGKWTNMLENACMKEEPPPSDEGSSPGGEELLGFTPSSRVDSTSPREDEIDD